MESPREHLCGGANAGARDQQVVAVQEVDPAGPNGRDRRQRIPETTETLYMLGEGDRVVGIAAFRPGLAEGRDSDDNGGPDSGPGTGGTPEVGRA